MKLKKFGFMIINKINEILNDSGFEYFCIAGTLLGIIREGHFLYHDDDIDIGIFENNNFSFLELEKIFNDNGIKKTRQFSHNGIITEQAYRIYGVNVDFFLFFRENGIIYHKGYFRDNNIKYCNKNDMSVLYIEYRDFSKLKEIYINNTKFIIPYDEQQFLRDEYGDTWTQPLPNFTVLDKHKRISKKFGHLDFFIE